MINYNKSQILPVSAIAVCFLLAAYRKVAKAVE